MSSSSCVLTADNLTALRYKTKDTATATAAARTTAHRIVVVVRGASQQFDERVHERFVVVVDLGTDIGTDDESHRVANEETDRGTDIGTDKESHRVIFLLKDII